MKMDKYFKNFDKKKLLLIDILPVQVFFYVTFGTVVHNDLQLVSSGHDRPQLDNVFMINHGEQAFRLHQNLSVISVAVFFDHKSLLGFNELHLGKSKSASKYRTEALEF